MAHDPEFVAETRSWLLKAQQDLASADTLRAPEASLLESAAFHCQQAAEKALKALLVWNGMTFGKTHDIRELGRAVVEVSEGMSTLLQEASVLTDYAWMYRYPGPSR